jgi:SAM-dependent methyltransferase
LAFVQDRRSPEEIERSYDHDIYGDYLIRVTDLETKFAGDLARYFDVLTASRLPAKPRILDVGCGKGHFLARLDPNHYERYGLEPSPPLAEQARKVVGPERVQACTLAQADYPSDFFDIVTLWAVIEHVPLPGALVADIHRVLKPGGLFLLFTPNFDSLFTRVARAMLACSGGRVRKPLSRFLNTSHILGFSLKSLGQLLARQGFEVQEVLQDERYVTRHGLGAFAWPMRLALRAATRISIILAVQEALVVCASKK